MTSTDHREPNMHFQNFKISGANKTVNQIWDCVWVVVVAELWKHRNRIFFFKMVRQTILKFSQWCS